MQDQYKSYYDSNIQSNQKNLSYEFNKIVNFKKPPLSRSPTPSKVSYVSQIGDSRSLTPNSGYSSSWGGIDSDSKQFDIVDSYKMKEIKQYVANELFKS